MDHLSQYLAIPGSPNYTGYLAYQQLKKLKVVQIYHLPHYHTCWPAEIREPDQHYPTRCPGYAKECLNSKIVINLLLSLLWIFSFISFDACKEHLVYAPFQSTVHITFSDKGHKCIGAYCIFSEYSLFHEILWSVINQRN